MDGAEHQIVTPYAFFSKKQEAFHYDMGNASWLLTIFDKFRTALRAGDLNPSLSSRNPDLLAAGRTLVNMMRLPLCTIALKPLPGCSETIRHLPIFLILRNSFIPIFRKHPKICINQCQYTDQIENLPSCQQRQNKSDQRYGNQKSRKLIHPISSIHKAS